MTWLAPALGLALLVLASLIAHALQGEPPHRS